MAAGKARKGPAKSTCSHIAQQTGQKTEPATKTAGQLSTNQSNSACDIILKDDRALLDCFVRCDDGTDESIASPRLTESEILSGIGKLRKINPVTIQVAVKDNIEALKFTFSREWNVPRLIMHLSVGLLALPNTMFFVADAALAENDLLIVQTVLKHLGLDSKTMLKNNHAQLNETDYSGVPRDTETSSSVDLILMAIVRKVNNKEIMEIGKDKKDKTDTSKDIQQRTR